MISILAGSTKPSIWEQWAKVDDLMFVIFSGISTVPVSWLLYWKAPSPIDNKVAGRCKVPEKLQPEKALSPIVFKFLGNTSSPLNLQLLKASASISVTPSGRFRLPLKPHRLNVAWLIFVIPCGIVKDPVMPSHWSKALSSICFKELGKCSSP